MLHLYSFWYHKNCIISKILVSLFEENKSTDYKDFAKKLQRSTVSVSRGEYLDVQPYDGQLKERSSIFVVLGTASSKLLPRL